MPLVASFELEQRSAVVSNAEAVTAAFAAFGVFPTILCSICCRFAYAAAVVVNGAQVLHLLCAAMVIDFTCADGRF